MREREIRTAYPETRRIVIEGGGTPSGLDGDWTVYAAVQVPNNNGQEVCWGFGDYGEHEYVVRYDLRHLVKSYDTCDGFNHCFVDMDCRIENASVTIMGDDGILLSEANTRRWAFGYEGRIEFEGNSIVAKPNETIGNGKRMIIMLEMDKGMFAPDTEGGEPWADKKQRALDGSDYTDNDDSLEDWGFWGLWGFWEDWGFWDFWDLRER